MSTQEFYEQPYRHYWRILYAEYAAPDSKAHWYGKWKTAEMCMGLFRERQRIRREWFAKSGQFSEEPHPMAIATFHASPVRSETVKLCLRCLWVSRDLDAHHAEH